MGLVVVRVPARAFDCLAVEVQKDGLIGARKTAESRDGHEEPRFEDFKSVRGDSAANRAAFPARECGRQP